MHELILHFPALATDTSRELDPAPRHLSAWLGTLRASEHEEVVERLLAVLHQYNRYPLDPAARFQVLMQISPLVQAVVKAVQERLAGSSFPLPERQRAKADLIMQLLQSVAEGYKRVIHETQTGDKNTGDKNNRVADGIELQSIYQAVVFLADSLLAAYLSYVPEPEHTWGELHRLYRYAEGKNLHMTAVKNHADGRELKTVNHAYRRVVLLFLANPYHLMSGEASTVYEHLDQWGVYGRLLAPERVTALEGKYFVNLSSDQPPQFAHQQVAPAANSELRVLDVSRLVETLASMLKKFSELQADPGVAAISFKERIHRDMLSRLEHAWGGRRERKDERLPSSSQVVMAAGLSASHHFVTAEVAFVPEQEEVLFHRPSGYSKPAFSLVPMEHEPWKTTDKLDKLEAGVDAPRVSQFIGAENLWEKIYATKAGANARKGELEREFTAQLWQQINGSSGGLGITCDGRGKNIRVGDIIVYQQGALNSAWKAGIVRWLRDLRENQLEIGVMAIEGTLRGVAVRSVGGVGSGGEYFRSLMVSDGDRETLLVPAAIYDVGTCMVLNNKTSLAYIHLNRIYETTTSFSQFGFEHIATPLSEQKNIEAIRAA